MLPIDNHNSRDDFPLIAGLAVVGSLAAIVSVIALLALIPPVGVVVGATLTAVAIKISIGAGIGSVLCGSAVFLFFKLSTPKEPENPKPQMDLEKDSRL